MYLRCTQTEINHYCCVCGEAWVRREEWPCDIHVQAGNNQGPTRKALGGCRDPVGM